MTRWSDACRSSSASTIPWFHHWQPRRSALRKERALTSSKRRMRAAKPRLVPRPALIMCASAISKLKRTLVAVSILSSVTSTGPSISRPGEVLAGEVPRQDIEGRIILVGTSAPGLLDLRATPLDTAIPGIDIHAQVIEHLLTGSFLTRPDYALALEESIILIFGILLASLLPRVSAKAAIAVGLLIMAGVLVGGWAAFRYLDLLLDPSYPAVALGFMALGITSYVYQGVEAQRSQIRGAFGRYLAPAVVQEMIAHPEQLQLGGEVRELTLLFCDVRNFTSISEHLSAGELTNFINELLSPLSEIILQHRGTIDKYMGDAIMAFWNAPVDDPDHRTHACQSALKMVAKMDELNEIWRQRAFAENKSYRPVRIGIGLNTGNCCVGNLRLELPVRLFGNWRRGQHDLPV